MPYTKISELPEAVRDALPVDAQKIFMNAFNGTYNKTKDDGQSSAAGWAAVKNAGYKKNEETGKWKKFATADVPFFKAGTYHKGTDREITYTDKDIDRLIKNTNEIIKKKLHLPFLKLGHVKEVKGAPRLGTVEKIKLIGKEVVAFVKDVPDKIAQRLKERYPRVSAEIFPILCGKQDVLRALALLGTDIEEVKGLSDIKINYGNENIEYIAYEDVFEFATWDETEESYRYTITESGLFKEGSFRTTDFDGKLPEGIKALRGRLKSNNEWATNTIIFSKDQWTLDKAKAWIKDRKFEEILQDVIIDSKMDKINKLNEEVSELQEKKERIEKFNKEKEEETMPLTEKELKEKEDKLKADKEKQEKEKKEFEAKQKEFDENQKKIKAKEKKEKVEFAIGELVKEGKVLPSQKDGHIITLMSMDIDKTIKVKGDDDVEKEITAFDSYIENLRLNVKQVDFAETATDSDKKKKDDSPTAKFEAEVKKYMKDNKDASYKDAVIAVTDEQPKLYEAYEAERIEIGDTSDKKHNTEEIKRD